MFDEYYQFRHQLVDALERDLLGPGSPDEVIADPPITKYIAGVLFPRDSDRTDPAQNLGEDAPAAEAGSDDSESWDPAVSMSYVRYPSSMGMTMTVDTTATKLITVTVSGARYVPVERADSAAEPTDSSPSDAEAGSAEFIGRRAKPRDQPDWRRVPLEADPVEIDVSKPCPGRSRPVGEGLELFRRVRPADEHGPGLRHARAYQHQGHQRPTGAMPTLFSRRPCGLRRQAAGPVFLHRPGVGLAVAEEDIESDRLLYRDAVSMATGHGTAVDWDSDPAAPGRATSDLHLHDPALRAPPCGQ